MVAPDAGCTARRSLAVYRPRWKRWKATPACSTASARRSATCRPAAGPSPRSRMSRTCCRPWRQRLVCRRASCVSSRPAGGRLTPRSRPTSNAGAAWRMMQRVARPGAPARRGVAARTGDHTGARINRDGNSIRGGKPGGAAARRAEHAAGGPGGASIIESERRTRGVGLAATGGRADARRAVGR